MAWFGNAFLKLLQTLIYAILFGCAALILGVYSYFLAVLANDNVPIDTWKKAVEGISGVAVAYLICAVILTCFLGGIRFFAFLAIILDLAFAGGFIAIAVLTRDGTDSCSGNVNTPLGSGPVQRNAAGYGANNFGFGGINLHNSNYSPDLQLACRLNKAAFAVSIIAAALFIIGAGLQLGIGRKHQRDKRYGPSPDNGYAVSGRRHFWQRKPATAPNGDAEVAAPGKISHETGYTGSTTAPMAPTTVTYDSTGQPINPAYHHPQPYAPQYGSATNY